MENTNIEKVKNIARVFANFEPKSTPIPGIVSHPFTQSSIVYDQEGYFDICKKDNWNRFMTYCEEVIDKAQNYSSFCMIITKPYRSAFFKETEKYAEGRDAAEYLKGL